jgi:hypothetical protein
MTAVSMRIAVHSTPRISNRQSASAGDVVVAVASGSRAVTETTRGWGQTCARTCARTVDDEKYLGIPEKFGG